MAHPIKLAFKTVNLSQARPVLVIIEQRTGLDGAFLKSAVTVIDLDGSLKIGL